MPYVLASPRPRATPLSCPGRSFASQGWLGALALRRTLCVAALVCPTDPVTKATRIGSPAASGGYTTSLASPGAQWLPAAGPQTVPRQHAQVDETVAAPWEPSRALAASLPLPRRALDPRRLAHRRKRYPTALRARGGPACAGARPAPAIEGAPPRSLLTLHAWRPPGSRSSVTTRQIGRAHV